MLGHLGTQWVVSTKLEDRLGIHTNTFQGFSTAIRLERHNIVVVFIAASKQRKLHPMAFKPIFELTESPRGAKGLKREERIECLRSLRMNSHRWFIVWTYRTMNGFRGRSTCIQETRSRLGNCQERYGVSNKRLRR
jgi:hypothetical protein